MQPGPLRLALENRTDTRVVPGVFVAGQQMHDLLGKRRPFLTAKRLLTNQTFREIYRTSTLDVDQRLKITSLTFLFTDLKGSTDLYERVGDLVAFDLVREHFRVLHEIIAAESGAVVKTIGDAVMATFATPDRAIAAALRMREAMRDLNQERQQRRPAAQDRHPRGPLPRGDAQRSPGLLRADGEHRVARAGARGVALDPGDRCRRRQSAKLGAARDRRHQADGAQAAGARHRGGAGGLRNSVSGDAETVLGARLSLYALNPAGPPALVTPEWGMSYAELLRRVQSCATWLAAEGCSRDQIVGITVADDFPHLVTSLALLALGVPQVCLPTTEPAGRRSDLAERLDVARIVVADARHALPGRPMSLLAPECYAPTGSALPNVIDADPDAPSVYHTSSGTTGQPKIYALSQRMIAWRGGHYIPSERLGPVFRSATLLAAEDPMGRARLHYCVAMGCTSVLSREELEWPVRDLCHRLGVTFVELGVLQLGELVADRSDLRPLPPGTVVATGGALPPAKLRQEFRARFGVPLFMHYGAREFGRIAASEAGSDDGDFETLGKPVPWIDFEIVDEEGKAVPAGEIGEVRVRAECMTREFYRDPQATARHFKDGWFHPRRPRIADSRRSSLPARSRR